MADQQRFAPQNQTTQQRISTNTVGLVALSDFRKRRAEVLEQQDREAREAALLPTTGTSTPDRSNTGTPDIAGSDTAARDDADDNDGARDGGVVGGPVKKKAKKKAKKLLSFADDEEGEDEIGPAITKSKTKKRADTADNDDDKTRTENEKKSKFKANAAVGVVPKVMTQAALRKEATEREALRREFLAIQEAVKATEIAIPFTFYDGANTPGGTVRVKKGDFIWVFLDRSRRVGAELAGEKATALKAWARVGVDDLMLVRGNIIIPHHYDFYYFLINKSVGPGGVRLFDYSTDGPNLPALPNKPTASLVTAASKAAAARSLPDVSTLEGASDDPAFTKVVDKRWYDKNKHIYPASTWQEFDAEKDYATDVRRDAGGNAFFYSR